LFDEEDHTNGISALLLSIMGISEGAIPFAGKYPKQTVLANVVGSAIAGGLAFLFCVGSHVPAGGLIVAFVGGIHADPGLVHTSIPSMFGGVNPGAPLAYLSIL
jgi:fructose-specific phosphotransferase system IIC component